MKKILMIAACAVLAVQANAQKNIPLVYDQEFTGAKYAEHQERRCLQYEEIKPTIV